MATRRPLTDEQRNIMQAERSHRRMQADVTRETVVREQVHRQSRVQTESDLAGGRRNRAIVGAVASTATPSSDSSLIMTTIFVIAGLALFYNLVTNASNFSGFVGTVGNFLHKVSSTAPLFQTVPGVAQVMSTTQQVTTPAPSTTPAK